MDGRKKLVSIMLEIQNDNDDDNDDDDNDDDNNHPTRISYERGGFNLGRVTAISIRD